MAITAIQAYTLLGDFYKSFNWFQEAWVASEKRARIAKWGTDDNMQILAQAFRDAMNASPRTEHSAAQHYQQDPDEYRAHVVAIIKAGEGVAGAADALGFDNTPILQFLKQGVPHFYTLPESVELLLERIDKRAETLSMSEAEKESAGGNAPEVGKGEEWGFTVKDAAEVIGCTPGRVSHLVDEGTIKAIGTGRKQRLNPRDVMALRRGRIERAEREKRDGRFGIS